LLTWSQRSSVSSVRARPKLPYPFHRRWTANAASATAPKTRSGMTRIARRPRRLRHEEAAVDPAQCHDGEPAGEGVRDPAADPEDEARLHVGHQQQPGPCRRGRAERQAEGGRRRLAADDPRQAAGEEDARRQPPQDDHAHHAGAEREQHLEQHHAERQGHPHLERDEDQAADEHVAIDVAPGNAPRAPLGAAHRQRRAGEEHECRRAEVGDPARQELPWRSRGGEVGAEPPEPHRIDEQPAGVEDA